MKHILCMLSGIVGLALFFLFLQLERTSPALAYVLMGLCPTAVFLLCPYPGEYSARLGTGGRLALSVLACGVGSALRSISDISIEHGVIAHPFHLPIALLLLLALASAGLAAYWPRALRCRPLNDRCRRIRQTGSGQNLPHMGRSRLRQPAPGGTKARKIRRVFRNC